jgi:hypothetical protein
MLLFIFLAWISPALLLGAYCILDHLRSARLSGHDKAVQAHIDPAADRSPVAAE